MEGSGLCWHTPHMLRLLCLGRHPTVTRLLLTETPGLLNEPRLMRIFLLRRWVLGLGW